MEMDVSHTFKKNVQKYKMHLFWSNVLFCDALKFSAQELYQKLYSEGAKFVKEITLQKTKSKY